jgi:hypothetical protein
VARKAGASVVGDPPEVAVSSLYKRGEPSAGFVLKHDCNMGRFKFTVVPEDNGIRVATAWRPPFAVGEEQHEYVSDIEWVPWHFDSRRPYINCCKCYRRVARAFLTTDKPFGRLYCGRCAKVRYRSQKHQLRVDRLAGRVASILGQLGSHPTAGALTTPLPAKPLGMRWETYNRHIAELHALQLELLAAIEEAKEISTRVLLADASKNIEKAYAELNRLVAWDARVRRHERAR